MHLSALYPVLATADVAASAAFWMEHFGFTATFSSEWYVSLRRPGPPDAEIAFVAADHATIPEGHRRTAAGVLINLEVDDVDALWQRLVVEGGRTPLLPLRSEAFGQRHFIVADPGGALVDIITEIPPDQEYAEAFADGPRSL